MRALVLLCVASPLLAQSPSLSRAPAAPPAGTGTVTGVVIDSLFTRGPLANADVIVDGVDRLVRTDANGRFRVDSVPEGERRVTFFHESLDAMHLQVGGPVAQVRAGRTARVTLTTPSAETLYPQLCGAPGNSMIGFVVGVSRATDSSGGVPVRRVVGRWTELALGRQSIAAVRREVEGRQTSDAMFVLCGVPRDGEVTVTAETADGRRGIALHQQGGAMAATLAVHLAARAPAGSRREAMVVRHADGERVRGAVFAAARDSVRLTTGDSGVVRLDTTLVRPDGVLVRAIGFFPLHVDIDSGARSVVVALDAMGAQQLDAVQVRARRLAGDVPEEFERRRRGGLGRYLTRDDVMRRSPVFLHTVFYGMPMVQVNDRSIAFTSGVDRACAPAYVLDGALINFSPFDFILPREIAGIEIYQGATRIPPEYSMFAGTCGVILIWTRRDAVTP
ncbi:MAG: carboxypeptidase-like regulatory domain-containing protein [Gemmatimonadaceae bacterium]|nr:carboxypeptidase-like regulatory domain-containing protein [Gemmatimonadaceae bacterium]